MFCINDLALARRNQPLWIAAAHRAGVAGFPRRML